MGLKTIAVKAVKWLVRAFNWYRGRNTEVKYVLGVMKRLGFATKQIEKFTRLLEKVERTSGARTDAWGKIQRGAKQNRAAALDAADTKYLYQFKRAFDKAIKKPFQKSTR